MKYRVKIYYTSPDLKAVTRTVKKSRPNWYSQGKEIVACTSYDIETLGMLTKDEELRWKDLVISDHFIKKEKNAKIYQVTIELLPPS